MPSFIDTMLSSLRASVAALAQRISNLQHQQDSTSHQVATLVQQAAVLPDVGHSYGHTLWVDPVNGSDAARTGLGSHEQPFLTLTAAAAFVGVSQGLADFEAPWTIIIQGTGAMPNEPGTVHFHSRRLNIIAPGVILPALQMDLVVAELFGSAKAPGFTLVGRPGNHWFDFTTATKASAGCIGVGNVALVQPAGAPITCSIVVENAICDGDITTNGCVSVTDFRRVGMNGRYFNAANGPNAAGTDIFINFEDSVLGPTGKICALILSGMSRSQWYGAVIVSSSQTLNDVDCNHVFIDAAALYTGPDDSVLVDDWTMFTYLTNAPAGIAVAKLRQTTVPSVPLTNNIWVDPAGSDVLYPGRGTQARPFKTLTAALAFLGISSQPVAQAGYTQAFFINVNPGTYSENITLGTYQNITFNLAPGVTINGHVTHNVDTSKRFGSGAGCSLNFIQVGGAQSAAVLGDGVNAYQKVTTAGQSLTVNYNLVNLKVSGQFLDDANQATFDAITAVNVFFAGSSTQYSIGSGARAFTTSSTSFKNCSFTGPVSTLALSTLQGCTFFQKIEGVTVGHAVKTQNWIDCSFSATASTPSATLAAGTTYNVDAFTNGELKKQGWAVHPNTVTILVIDDTTAIVST